MFIIEFGFTGIKFNKGMLFNQYEKYPIYTIRFLIITITKPQNQAYVKGKLEAEKRVSLLQEYKNDYQEYKNDYHDCHNRLNEVRQNKTLRDAKMIVCNPEE